MLKTFSSHLSRSAYSLAEVAIAMAVLGILAGTFFDVKTIKYEVENINNINKQMLEIEEAIDTFVAKNGYLPCPARRTDAVSTANFGVATDCTTAAPFGTVETGSGVDTIRIGVLPVRNLDLPDSMMFDPWNNRITYAVAKELAQTTIKYDAYTTASTDVIRINDANGNRINRINQSGNESVVSWVVASHGKDGRGAYNYNGVLKSCTASLDQENCDDDNIFIDTAYNPSAANAFDDYLRWKSKTQQSYDKQTMIAPGSNATQEQCPTMYDPNTFSPTEISGIRLWLDAKDTTTLFANSSCTTAITNNTDALCWKDKSGNNYLAKQTSGSGGDSPRWYSNSGNSYVSFQQEYLSINGSGTGAVFPSGTNLSQMEFFMVSRTTLIDSGRSFSYAVGNDIKMCLPYGGNVFNWQFNNYNSGNTAPFPYSASTRYLWNCYSYYNAGGGSELKCWNNDSQIVSSNSTGPSVTTGTQSFFIGCESASKTYCQNMYLYEFIIYNRRLTIEERQKVRAYLYKRWGF